MAPKGSLSFPSTRMRCNHGHYLSWIAIPISNPVRYYLIDDEDLPTDCWFHDQLSADRVECHPASLGMICGYPIKFSRALFSTYTYHSVNIEVLNQIGK